MSYQQESYQFLQETRREIDRLTQKIESLKKVERLLDGMLSGSAPFDPVAPPRPATRPEKSPEHESTPIEISGYPLFAESRRGEKNHIDQSDSSLKESPDAFRQAKSERIKEPFQTLAPEQNTPSGSDFSQGMGSWGELAITALKSSPHPMSLDELVSRVSKMEGCPSSSDPRNAIRVALTRRKGDVKRESRGFYQLIDG